MTLLSEVGAGHVEALSGKQRREAIRMILQFLRECSLHSAEAALASEARLGPVSAGFDAFCRAFHARDWEECGALLLGFIAEDAGRGRAQQLLHLCRFAVSVQQGDPLQALRLLRSQESHALPESAQTLQQMGAALCTGLWPGGVGSMEEALFAELCGTEPL